MSLSLLLLLVACGPKVERGTLEDRWGHPRSELAGCVREERTYDEPMRRYHYDDNGYVRLEEVPRSGGDWRTEITRETSLDHLGRPFRVVTRKDSYGVTVTTEQRTYEGDSWRLSRVQTVEEDDSGEVEERVVSYAWTKGGYTAAWDGDFASCVKHATLGRGLRMAAAQTFCGGALEASETVAYAGERMVFNGVVDRMYQSLDYVMNETLTYDAAGRLVASSLELYAAPDGEPRGDSDWIEQTYSWACP